MSTGDYTPTSHYTEKGVLQLFDLQEYMNPVNWKVGPEDYDRPAFGKEFEPEEFMEDILFALADSRRTYYNQEHKVSVFERNGQEQVLIKAFYEEVVDPSPLDIGISRLEDDSYPLNDSGSSSCRLIAKAEVDDIKTVNTLLS